GHRFVLITGGGKIARLYQGALSTTTDASHEDLDWIGIYATHLNARLVQMVFAPHAYESIITSPDQAYLADADASVIVGGGWTPGNSTDFVATSLAEQSEAPYVLNLSNITYAYTKDPDTYDDAEPIYDMQWSEFQTLFNTEWTPGASVPFDPAATNKAAEHGLEVRIMNDSSPRLTNFI
ncbi:MAG: UMP kinase, partial [Candidatus Paceibacteria bacterium]